MNNDGQITISDVHELYARYDAMLESGVVFPMTVLHDISQQPRIVLHGLMPWIISNLNSFQGVKEHQIVCELVESTTYMHESFLRKFLPLLGTDNLSIFARTVQCLDKVAPGWRAIFSETSSARSRLLSAGDDLKRATIIELECAHRKDALALRPFYCSLSYLFLFDSSSEIKRLAGSLLIADAVRYSYYIMCHKSVFKHTLKHALRYVDSARSLRAALAACKSSDRSTIQ
jgi:hypothetical protein